MNDHPSKSELEYIRGELTAFNEQIVGSDNHTALHLVEYDESGAIVGGLVGGTYWGWLYIDILWVREDRRRTGIGSRLLAAAEEQARARGCHHVHVDTMSWQAPLFYQKHGYKLIGTLPDIPKGNQKHLLFKQL